MLTFQPSKMGTNILQAMPANDLKPEFHSESF